MSSSLDALNHFLDSEKRLTVFPAKRKMKLYALQYLSTKLEPGTVYSEKELNEILNRWHTFGDPATLRRELYNFKFIDRKLSGEAYWLEPIQPAVESFL